MATAHYAKDGASFSLRLAQQECDIEVSIFGGLWNLDLNGQIPS